MRLLIISLLIPCMSFAQRVSHFEKPWFENKQAIIIEKASNALLDGYDVKYYELDLNITNLNKTISGSGLVYAQVVSAPLTAIVLELHSSLVIDSVQVNGLPALFTEAGDEMTIALGTPLAIGQYFEAKVFYHGTSSGTGIKNGNSPSWGEQITWTLSESYHALDWFPCKQILTDKADSVTVFLNFPNTLLAGSIGNLVSLTPIAGNKLRAEWRSHYPIAYYLISFTVSDYIEYNLYAHPAGTTDSLLIQNYVYNNSGYIPYFQTEIDNTVEFIELLSERYGLYPFMNEKYGHCTAPIGGGMEHQTMTTLSYFDFELVIHELGHQWFGDNVTCSNWQDIWVNEGFATYTYYVGSEVLINQADADAWMQGVHDDIMSDPDGSIFVPLAQVMDEGRIFDYRLTYEKGAAILHQIRFILDDDDLFFSVYRNFQQTYTDSTASAQDFVYILEALSGTDFSTYFDQWYYGEGYPTYDVIWNQDNDIVNIQLNQTGSMPFITPFFQIPVEVKFSWAGGDTTIRLNQQINNETFTLTIPHPVTQVELDPANWIVNDVGSITVGIPEKAFSAGILAYPNPASDYCELSFPSGTEINQVILLDAGGRTIRSWSGSSENLGIQTNELESGSYYLVVYFREGVKRIPLQVIH